MKTSGVDGKKGGGGWSDLHFLPPADQDPPSIARRQPTSANSLPPSAHSPLLKDRWAWALWAVFVLRATAYISVTPVWEGFDEHVHFAYVQHLAERGRIPVQGRDWVSREIAESFAAMPLPYFPKAFGMGRTHDDWWKAPEPSRGRSAVARAPAGHRTALPESPREYLRLYQAQHGPLYYLLSVVPYRLFYGYDLLSRVFAVRFFSILLASTVALSGFYVFRQMFHDVRVARALTAVMVFMPGLMTDTCRVGNDSLSVALFSAIVASCVRPSPWTWRRSVAIGVLWGAGLLTKMYFAAALPAVLSALAMSFLRGRPWRVKAFFREAAVVVSVGVAIAGWWFARNVRLHGDLSGVQQNVADKSLTFSEVVRNLPNVDWGRAVDTTFVSHIWFGNWSFLSLRSWVYRVFAAIYLAALAGVFVQGCSRTWHWWTSWRDGRARDRSEPPLETGPGPAGVRSPAAGGRRPVETPALSGLPAPPPSRWSDAGPATVHLGILLGFYFWFHMGLAYYTSLTHLANGATGVGGWYAYTAVVPETGWLFYGLWRWFRSDSWKQRSAAFLLLCFATLDIYGMFWVLIPYYTGIIAHAPNGFLESFRPFDEAREVLVSIPGRLTLHKPIFMGSHYFTSLLLAFFTLTAGALVLAGKCLLRPFRPAGPDGRRRAGEPPPRETR